MKVIFSNDFDRELYNRGGLIKLSYFRLGKFSSKNPDYENPVKLSDYKKLNSIWLEHFNKLSISLDLSVLLEDETALLESLEDDRNVIIVYYSDINDNILGKAFTLVGNMVNDIPEKLKLHKKNNYISVLFPKTILTNLVCSYPGKEKLEEDSGIKGVNSFLASEFEEDNYLTKDSLFKFIRHKISKSNEEPNFLNENGEKITNVTYYRQYRIIHIEPYEIPGKDGTYYINDGGNFTVVGYCIYDLYKNVNNKFVLTQKGCQEGLDNTFIKYVNDKGEIEKTPDGIIIEDKGVKQVIFNKFYQKTSSGFVGVITFTDLISGKEVTIKSNIINIVTYTNWYAEFSTSYSEVDKNSNISYPLILFDTSSGNTGWEPSNPDDKSSGLINIYLDQPVEYSNIDIVNNEGVSILNAKNEFFSYNINRETIIDKDTNLTIYKYIVELHTTRNNDTGHWFPEDNEKKSILKLYTIKIAGNSEKTSSFFCVQRCISKLSLKGISKENQDETIESYNGEIIVDPNFGITKNPNLFISSNDFNDRYKYWKIDVDLDNRIFIDISSNKILEGNEADSQFTLLTRHQVCYSGNFAEIFTEKGKKIGSFKIKRVSPHGLGKTNNWEDEIYCHSDNDTIITVKKTFTSEKNNPMKVISNTPYIYQNSEGINCKLFIFDENYNDSIDISFEPNNNINPTDYKYSDNFIELEKYFNIRILNSLKGGRTYSISINKDNVYRNYDRPLKAIITHYYNYNHGEIYTEEFYCIVKPPSIDKSVKILDKDNKEINSYTFNNTTDIVGLKLVNTDSLLGDTFNYWGTVSKDPSISIISYNKKFNTEVDTEPNVQLKNMVESSTTIDENRNPFIFRRLLKEYQSTEFILRDWKNQLVESDLFKLDLNVEGLPPTERVKVYYVDRFDGIKKIINDEESLLLSNIGIYKLYIESENEFRLTLNEVNKSEGIYFFNPETNEILKDINIIEESAFNTVSGKDIYLGFIGKEPDNFDVEEKLFKTELIVTDLSTNKSTVVKFRRNYKSLRSNIEEIITPSSYRINDNTIILKDGQTKFPINYISSLETRFDYLKSEHPISLSDTIINLDEKYYRDIHEYLYNGYISTNDIFDVSRLIYSDNLIQTFPIKLINRLTVHHSNNKINSFNKDSLIYNFYRLPKIFTTRLEGLDKDSIELQFLKDSYKIFRIISPIDFSQKIEIGNRLDNGDIKWITIDLTSNKEVESPNKLFRIKVETEGFSKNYTITITENTGTNFIKETREEIGYFRVTPWIKKENFLLDSNNNSVYIENQSTVDNIINPDGRLTTQFSIFRLPGNESGSYITWDRASDLVSYNGESRIFTVSNNLYPGGVIDYEAIKNSNHLFIESIEPLPSSKEKELRFKTTFVSRIIQEDYRESIEKNSLGIPVEVDLIGNKAVLKKSILDKMSPILSKKPINFDVDISYPGQSSSITEKINTKNLYQADWYCGMKIIKGDMSSADYGRLYVGNYYDHDKIVLGKGVRKIAFSISLMCFKKKTTIYGDQWVDIGVEGNVKVTTNNGSRVELVLSDELDKIDGFFKNLIAYVDVPVNTGTSDVVEVVTIANKTTDTLDYVNSISFDIIVPPEKMDLYLTEDPGFKTGVDGYGNSIYTNSLDNKVTDLVFSDSGKLTYPNDLYVLIESKKLNGPENGLPSLTMDYTATHYYRLEVIDQSTNSEGYTKTKIPDYISPNFENRRPEGKVNYNNIYFEKKGYVGKHFDDKTKKTYYIYNLGLTSRMTSFSSTKDLLNDKVNSKSLGYEGTAQLKYNSSYNPLIVNTKYGYSRLYVTGPTDTDIDVPGGYSSLTSREYSFNLEKIYTNFTKSVETTKTYYSNNPNNIISSSKSNTYILNNKLVIDYDDTESKLPGGLQKYNRRVNCIPKNETGKIINMWDEFGFYAGFTFNYKRSEFKYNRSSRKLEFTNTIKYLKIKLVSGKEGFNKLCLLVPESGLSKNLREGYLGNSNSDPQYEDGIKTTNFVYYSYLEDNGSFQEYGGPKGPSLGKPDIGGPSKSYGFIDTDGSVSYDYSFTNPNIFMPGAILHFYYKEDQLSENIGNLIKDGSIFKGNLKLEVDKIDNYVVGVSEEIDPVIYDIELRIKLNN